VARRTNRRAAPEPLITPKRILGGCVVIISAFLFFGTYMVLAVTMLPTLVAYFVDNSPKKFLFRCVGSVNVCGSMPALIELWILGQNMDATQAVLLNPIHWLWAYGSAGIGWLLFTMVPRAIATYVSHKAQKRVETLRRKQQKLIEEWGREVAREVRGSAEGMDEEGAEPLGLDDDLDDDDDDGFASLAPPQGSREKVGSSSPSSSASKDKGAATSPAKSSGSPAYDENLGDIELPAFEEEDAPAQL